MSIRLSILSLGLLLASARAVLFTDPTQLKKTTYDFVIVGGKAISCVKRWYNWELTCFETQLVPQEVSSPTDSRRTSTSWLLRLA